MKITNKIIDYIYSIYFNFHYLPFRQAIKMPIILNGAQLYAMKGTVKIESDFIRKGMIKLGMEGVYLFYPHRGVTWQNHGGCVIFSGECRIGAGSSLSISEKATLNIGSGFRNTYGLKLIVSRNILIGENCRFGWNVFIMDTNMHPLKDSITNKRGSGGKDIIIGDYNWFSTNCVILPGVVTPSRVIVAMGSIVTRGNDYKSWCMYGGSPIKLLRENVYRDYNDDEDEMVFGPFKEDKS